MAITLVQSTFSNSTNSCAYGSNNTAGNLIVVVSAGGHGDTQTISDSHSNSYSAYNTINSSGLVDRQDIWYAWNIAGGANTVSISVDYTLTQIRIYEFSGIKNTSTPIDGHSTTGTITTTGNGDLVFAAGERYNPGSDFTFGYAGGYTPGVTTHTYISGGYYAHTGDEWIIQGAAGSISPSFTGGSNSYVVLAGFLAAPSASYLPQLMTMGMG